MVHGNVCPPLRAGGIEAAGYTHLAPGYEMIRLGPAYANIVTTCDGTVDYLIGGRWKPGPPGTVLIAPHGVAHGVRTLSKPALTAWAAFAPVPANFATLRPWDHALARLVGPKEHHPLLWALQGLYWESTGANDHTTLGHWADLVVTAATRLAGEQHDPTAALRPAWEAVDADLARPWTADAIAQLAGLSASHFRRLCRQHLGHSPAHHLAQLRMQRAAMLLKTTDQKLATIAASLGYQNVFAFSVAFKRLIGLAPANYRAASPRATA
jgi:AraC-like DNA-binding protein